MRFYEIIGESETADTNIWRGVSLRYLNKQKKRLKKTMAAEQERLKLVAHMYKSAANIEQQLDLADKALDVEERKLDIMLKRKELHSKIA